VEGATLSFLWSGIHACLLRRLDTRSYKKGIKISKAEMKRLDITGDQFHPEWNYTIRPRQKVGASALKRMTAGPFLW
jgi:hypothetical protein